MHRKIKLRDAPLLREVGEAEREMQQAARLASEATKLHQLWVDEQQQVQNAVYVGQTASKKAEDRTPAMRDACQAQRCLLEN
jgi:hypothetical protein